MLNPILHLFFTRFSHVKRLFPDAPATTRNWGPRAEGLHLHPGLRNVDLCHGGLDQRVVFTPFGSWLVGWLVGVFCEIFWLQRCSKKPDLEGMIGVNTDMLIDVSTRQGRTTGSIPMGWPG